MKTTENTLNLCNEFTFYDHYNFIRVVELKYICGYVFIILSENILNMRKFAI